MTQSKLRLLIGMGIALATVTSCAREHDGDGSRAAEDGGATQDAAALPHAKTRRSDPKQPGPLDAASAPPRIELLDGATWPSGLWVGQSAFADVCGTESRRVSMRFESGDDGTAPRGLVVFGEHERVAPVDPEHGYPEPHVGQSAYRCPREKLYDGYPYAIREATVWPDGRMTIWLSPDEMYDDWCVSQTSYRGSVLTDVGYSSEDEHTCVSLPLSQYRLCNGDPAACPVNYDKFHLCVDGYCNCNETGCRARFVQTVRIVLAVVDQRMEGVLQTQDVSRGTGIKLRWVE
jgi:hypothetical protein